VTLDPPANPPAARDLKEILRRRAEQAPKAEAASRWLDFARVLDLVRSEDSESKAAEAAASKAAGAEPVLPAARFAALVFLGQVAREEDDARQALERALVLAPGPGERALVLAELGDLAQRQHRPEAALQRWRQAAAADPTSVPAELALAGEEREAGLYAAALQRLEALPAGARSASVVREAHAHALEAMDRLAEAEAERRQLWDTRRSDAELLRDLAGEARRRGDQSQAAQRYGGVYYGGYLEDPQLPGTGVQMTRCLGDADLARVLNREPEIELIALERHELGALLEQRAVPIGIHVEGILHRLGEGLVGLGPQVGLRNGNTELELGPGALRLGEGDGA